ncbi:MAG TPA: antitoxin [Nitrospiraceae bacterium]|nr:antitoxin [Nitrospiraceae bacterium]
MNKFIERIVSDPQVCSGKPCIKGTRIPVHIILDLLAAGENFAGIKKAYPNITDEDIRACLSYASILADEEAGVAV